jgi:hypothetical protein
MKKKIIIILSAITLCLGLTGCSENANMSYTENSDIYIWTDKETGVQYIIYCHGVGYQGMGGITPRLNADGSLYIENR